MAKVTYHGEFPADKDEIEQHGYVFERGKSVDVKEKELLAKFAGNRFFKTEGSDKDVVEQGQAEAEQAEIEALQAYLTEERVPFHHKLGLSKLRDLKEAHEDAKLKAQDA